MMTDKVRRTPQGVRGLKWDIVEIMHSLYRSHPARGAWIEMLEYDVPSARPRRTPARGAWIEIIPTEEMADPDAGRTPQGVRGLKLAYGQDRYRHLLSHPARGAWIEMPSPRPSPPPCRSHPARGAWIEIRPAGRGQTPTAVAPRKGCVD